MCCSSSKSTRWLLGVVALAALVLTPQAALAQCSASAAPAYPTTVTVGDTGVAVSLILTNTSATVGTGGCGTIAVPFVDHVPSCVSGIGTCTVVDPNVFAVAPLTGAGCGTTWTVSALGDPAGTYRFTPADPVTIAPAGGTCTINFSVNVLKAPVDSNAGVLGLQTLQLGIGQFPSTEVSQTATATGQDETTVIACPPGSVCRAAVGACDVAEVCPASGDVCPPDTFAPSTTECRASAGVCDVAESCPGTGPACPADVFAPSTTECRASAGVCDVAESCPGNAAACPADVFSPSTTECRASAGVCDVAESCPGNAAACPADVFAASTTTCRVSAGVCDVAESCPGNAAACPADVFSPSTTECRASAGVCDVAESCPGNAATCPADVFAASTTVCRTSTGACDPAESCPGGSATCPTDVPFDPNIPGCVEAACRTVGYWGTHAGTERNGQGVNVTQLTLNLAGGSMQICGQTLTNTNVENGSSLLEGLCDSGGGRTQLARQLIALSLNCISSGNPVGSANCVGIAPFEAAFTACNTACASGTNQEINACIGIVDCLNNGGTPAQSNGQFFCATGTCSDNGASCTATNKSLCATPGTATCNIATTTCHDQALLFPDSPASSSNSCNDARRSDCDIFNSSCDVP